MNYTPFGGRVSKYDFSKLNEYKWEYILPAVAFITAFALRYYFLVTYSHPMMIHEQDAVGYMEAAKSILKMEFPTVSGRPPGYPVVIAIFTMLPVDLEYAARLASIFMDALIVLPLYTLARLCLDRIPAFGATLLWCFFPFSLIFTPSPLSQSSFLFYLLLGIVSLYHGLKYKKYCWLFSAGLAFALCFLTRPEGIVALGCGLLLCLLQLFVNGESRKKTVFLTVTFLTGFLLLAGPYFIAFHSELGYWGLTPKTEAALKTQDGTMILNSRGELEKTRAGVSVWKEYYGTLPVFFSSVRSNIKAYFMVFYNTFPLWMHIVSLIGMLTLLSRRKRGLLPYILILFAVTAPNYIVNVSKGHSYIYSVFPAVFIFFAACLESSARVTELLIVNFRLSIRPLISQVCLGSLILLAVACVSFGFYQAADTNYRSPESIQEVLITKNIYKEPAEIIKNNSDKSDVVMTRWGLVGYFAERPVLSLPKGGCREVISYGRKNGASFMLIDSVAVFSRRQELMELLGPLEGKTVNPEYGIELFSKQFFPGLGHGYVIYRYPPQRN